MNSRRYVEATDDLPAYWVDQGSGIGVGVLDTQGEEGWDHVSPAVLFALADSLGVDVINRGQRHIEGTGMRWLMYRRRANGWVTDLCERISASCPVDPVRDERRRENDEMTQDAREMNTRHPSLLITRKVGR